MSDHYYSQNPTVKSNPKEWESTLAGSVLKFTSDSGVFSKKEVDFGTRVLIEQFISNTPTCDKVLDVGCGYGPIGIAVGKSYPNCKVHMIDVNERAIQLAKENAKRNQVHAEIYASDLYGCVTEENFNAIISNPPIRAGKEVVHAIIQLAHGKLSDEGRLWIVIQQKQGAPSALKKMNEIFGNTEVIAKKKGYYILCSKKISTENKFV